MIARWPSILAGLTLAACASAPPDAAPAPLPAPEPREASVLATFTGDLDTRTGVLSLRQDRPAGPSSSLASAPGFAAAIPEGPTAVTIGNQVGSKWNNESKPGYCATNSTGAVVELTSNYGASTKLTNVFAEITSTAPSTSGNACNPSTGAAGYAYLNPSFGAWSYGDVTSGQTKTAPWAFTYDSGVQYTFQGRIVGQRVETSAVQAYTVSTSQTMMGSGWWGVFFVDTTNNRVICVWQDGTIHTSATLSGPITALASDANDNGAFAITGGPDPALVEITYDCYAYEYPTSEAYFGQFTPVGLAVYSGSAFVGIGGTNKVTSWDGFEFGWYSPADMGAPVTNPAAVLQGGTGYVYFSTAATNVLKRYNWSYRAADSDVTISQAACRRSTTSLALVAGPNGSVWFTGDGGVAGSPGQLCSVTGTTTTAEATMAGTLGLTLGTDGNMWADGTAGISRLWVGLTNHNTWLALNGVGGSGAATGGIVSGAGGIWFPTTSGGSTTFTRIVP